MHFWKCIFLLQKYFGPQICSPYVKIESKISVLGEKISILHRQMTEHWLSFEVDEEIVKNQKKCIFKNAFFCSKNICLGHVKIKSKISVLGEKISILLRQMTEQLHFEVNVKFVPKKKRSSRRRTTKQIYIDRKYESLGVQN